jgi:putative Holliday junction resolvase
MSRILAIDYGTKRIGLAISDRERKIASPLAVYERRDQAADRQFFVKLVEDERAELLLVGLPIRARGEEGQKAKEARALGAWLAEQTKQPVVYWDEAFTTAEAEQALWDAGLSHKERRARRDMIAARMLLQAYLDAGCPEV